MTDPIIPVDEVLEEVSFEAESVGLSEQGFENLVERLINEEAERVGYAVGVTLGQETTEELLSRPDHVLGHDLPMPKPKRPVDEVESVDIDEWRADGPDVDLNDVAVHPTHLELLPDAPREEWPTERRAVSVEWSYGYTSDDLPAPIRSAIVGLVRHRLLSIDFGGLESESVDGHSVSPEPAEDVVRRHLTKARQADVPEYYGGVNIV